MGTIHRRPPYEVRTEALRHAGEKLRAGCVACAEGYLRLAREHGASEAEVRQVRDAHQPAGPHHTSHTASLNRRDLLKWAGAALAAGVASPFLLTRTAQAHHVASQVASLASFGYFGVDSCTAPDVGGVAGMPVNFYIAELGATNNGLGCFNPTTSQLVGEDFTHGYWGLSGPNFAPAPASVNPASVSPLLPAASIFAAYGITQAQAALAAWQTTPGVAGKTLFADVEAGFGGWGDPMTPQQGAELLDGFLVTIAAAGFVPGVYINNSSRDAWFPPDYRAAVPFVYWVAGGPAAGQMAGPCVQGDTLGGVTALWSQQVQQETFAGISAILWQYWPSDLGCGGDFNFSPQSGNAAFTPGPLPRQ